MSTDPKWAADGAVSSEPHTDPMLPVITDDMLPPLANPRVPTLDDRTLAQLLAELEGEENVAPGSSEQWLDPLDPVEALERARPRGPVLALGAPPALPPGPRQEVPEPPAGPSPAEPAVTDREASAARAAVPPLPTQQSQPTPAQQSPAQPPRAQFVPTQPAPALTTPAVKTPTQPPCAPRPGVAPAREPRSRYGEYRPPIRGAHDEVPSLIGLTRRSQSKLGSRLFTVAFVAIFVLIVIQTIASMVSASH